MNKKTPNSCSTNDSPRCQHRTATGRRCRLRVLDASSQLCLRHAHLQQQKREVADLAPDLVGELVRFQSASDINQVLSKLLLLLSQDRISPRRAAVLAYINSLLLRTLPAIEQELHPKSNQHSAPPTYVIDIPGPPREQPHQAP